MMDGSRPDYGCIGANIVWCNLKWKTRKMYQGTNKEVFGAELYGIGEALEITLQVDRN